VAVDPWALDAPSGAPSYSGQDLRLGTVAPLAAGVGTSLAARSGVRHSGSGTDLLVSAQSSPNMSVKVSPGVCLVQCATAGQGPYTWALTATKTLTIGTAHATLARTDLVVVRIRDANVDTSGARDGDVVLVPGAAGSGAPALPSDATYMEIARVTVGPGVTTIPSSAITDRRPFTAALGGVLPATATTEPAASSVGPQQIVCRTDLTGAPLRRSDGTTWRMAVPYRARTVLSAPSNGVTFSGLTGLRNLTVRVQARADYAADTMPLLLRFDGDTGSSLYAGVFTHIAETSGTRSEYHGTQNFLQAGVIAGNTGSTAECGISTIHIAISPTFFTTMTYYSGTMKSLGAYEHGTGCYTNGADRDSITLLPFYAPFTAGSSFDLEGWD
jgi:hypothetical protein